VFWVISVYFNIRNTLPKSGTFLLGHPVCVVVGNNTCVSTGMLQHNGKHTTKTDSRSVRLLQMCVCVCVCCVLYWLERMHVGTDLKKFELQNCLT